MVDAIIKTSVLIGGLFSTILYKSGKKAEIALDSTIEATEEVVESVGQLAKGTIKVTSDLTKDMVDSTSELAKNITEDLEIFLHKEKLLGTFFLLFVIVVLIYSKK